MLSQKHGRMLYMLSVAAAHRDARESCSSRFLVEDFRIFVRSFLWVLTELLAIVFTTEEL